MVVEESMEICKERKISKWIRYPLGFLLTLFILFIFAVIGIVGMGLILKNRLETIFGGILFIVFDIILIVSSYKKVKNYLKENKK